MGVSSDLVLDVPLFMSCPGRTEPAQEIVLGMESGEQFRFLDFILDAMTHAGCIVKNQQSGDATDVLKNMFQSFTDTFRRFTSENLFITVVAVKKGDDQIFQPFFVPFVNEISFAEIDLGTSRLPDEFQVSPFFFTFLT